MSNAALPEHLRGKLHDDWIFPFKYIPRSWNAFKFKQPPKLLCGRKVYDWTSRMYKTGSITEERGSDPCQKSIWAWAITFPLHFTISFGKTGRYLRIGFRYDTIDEYYNLGMALKEIDGGLIKPEKMRITHRGYSRWYK